MIFLAANLIYSIFNQQDLIIGRPEAVYFYEVDGRGPCWAFDGEKKFVGWFRGYLLCIMEDQRTQKGTLNVYDLKNRLIARCMPVGDVSHLVCEWGYIILIMADNKILCIGEKDMESKLDMLFKKNLYTVAINLVQNQQADPASTAEVLRKTICMGNRNMMRLCPSISTLLVILNHHMLYRSSLMQSASTT